MAENEEKAKPQATSPSANEAFLRSVERRVTDPVHLRLLRACRDPNPTMAMERELGQALLDILHET